MTYTYGENGAKTGYVVSKSVSVKKMCMLTDILKGAEIVYHSRGREEGITTKDADKSIYAPHSGRVTAYYDEISKVWLVEIQSDNGKVSTLFRYLTNVQVKDGDRVKGGQLLGAMGTRADGRNQDNNLDLFMNDPHNPDKMISTFFGMEN